MSAPIGPGDWVECIDDRPHAASGERGLVRGALYRVRDYFDIRGRQGLRVHGVALGIQPSSRQERAWNANRFRPVYRPKQTVIESLKAPPERALEPA